MLSISLLKNFQSNWIPCKLFLIISVIVLIFTNCPASAFQCYVCDSKSDIECVEYLPADSRLVPRDCANITGAKFCIKTTNIYAGELGTKRFCAANDHGNYCKYVKQQTGDREYRSCIYTCNSENCNGSYSNLLNKQTILLIAIPMTLMSLIVNLKSRNSL